MAEDLSDEEMAIGLPESLSSPEVESPEGTEMILVLVPRGGKPSQKPGHQLDENRGPYWCPETHRFYRKARLLFPHLFCAGCPSPLGGVKRGVLGRVIGVEVL
jgi:hypothetical protein